MADKRDWITDEEATRLLEKAEEQFQSVFRLYVWECQEFYARRGVLDWSGSLVDLFFMTNHILSISSQFGSYSELCEFVGSEERFREIRSLALDRLSEITEEDVNKFLGTVPVESFFRQFSEALTHDLQEGHNEEELLTGLVYGFDLIDMVLEFCRQFDVGDDVVVGWQRGYCKLGFVACFNMAIEHWYVWYKIFPTLFALDMLSNGTKIFHDLCWEMAAWVVNQSPHELTTDECKTARLLLETKMTKECFEKLVSEANKKRSNNFERGGVI